MTCRKASPLSRLHQEDLNCQPQDLEADRKGDPNIREVRLSYSTILQYKVFRKQKCS